MTGYVCIHGHFYQPPRENPWLEAIEREESAAPYHDWNERVAAECYAPNAAARILDERERIVRLANNYARISFNVGPTLMAWLESESPATYRAILEADRESRERFGGHGSAIAQPYNHMILPLASERDRRTQVVWGIRDFHSRFGRDPVGMWLPETAVDLASLETLAEAGIRFTILAPHQAARVRPLGSAEWREARDSLDPTRPYLQRLPSGREIVAFFYDGGLARDVAFGELLRDGRRFAERLLEGLGRDLGLVHVAADGETYGHHHPHGEMALAYALERIREVEGVELVNYGRYLELHPPEDEAMVAEGTSWSCAHGVERWRSDCGCHTGGEPGWSQSWRGPLREALDWLRDRLERPWERRAGELLRDPWEARDGYIDVVLDRSRDSVERFLAGHSRRPPTAEERVEILKLLELQRHLMLMYTSCGWFFHDLGGIETVQVLGYAGRAVELAEGTLEERVEAEFLDRLSRARSNVPERGDGRRIFETAVRPAAAGLERVCAHHVLSDLFDGHPDAGDRRIYCYRVSDRVHEPERAGRATLVTGVAEVVSEITEEQGTFAYGALHFGKHQVRAGVRSHEGEAAYREAAGAVREAFGRGDFPGAIRRIERHFGEGGYSLADLFRDERQRIVDRILRSTLEEVEEVYREVYERHAPLMRFVAGLGAPQPAALEAAGEFVLNGELRRLLEQEVPEPERMAALLEEARARRVRLDGETLGPALAVAALRLARRLADEPLRRERLASLRRAVELARTAPFPVELWEVQNAYWELLRTALPAVSDRARSGDAEAAAWVAQFVELGDLLSFAVEGLAAATAPTG